MTILYFIIALGILIFIHEFGHFIVAKRAGICVEVFSLGFGPRILGIKVGDTDYRISALPLGGYVKMMGEEPGEEGAKDPRSFSAKGVFARTKVVVFGPLMNLFLTLAVMPIVFMIGRAEPVFLQDPPIINDIKAESPAQDAGLSKSDLIVSINGKKVETWDDVLNKILLSPKSDLTFGVMREGRFVPITVKVGDMPELGGGYVGIEPMLFIGSEPLVGEMKSDGPAAKAGIKPGDLVVSFGEKKIYDWLDLTKLVNESAGKDTTLVVQRDGNMLSFPIKAEYSEQFGRWIIGITKNRMSGVPMKVQTYGFLGACVKGTKENLKLARLTFDVLGKLVTAKISYKVIGGPVVIAKASAAAAASGLSNFLYFIAFLSMQLSILNFLPIPVLDGGQLVFLGWEAVLRRPLSIRIRMIAHQVGFVLLISLMLLVTINDIENVWGIKSLIKKLF